MPRGWHIDRMTTATTHISAPTAADAVVLRPAMPSDADALRRLAELDSASPLSGPILVAERGGEIAAALDLHSGRAIADPFSKTAGLVSLLRTRADLLRRATVGRRRRALPLLQRARQAA